MRRRLTGIVALSALLLALVAVWRLEATRAGIGIGDATVGTTPVRVFSPLRQPTTPVVVIAHGFAGSQQLMQSFALTLARHGLTAVTYDLLGHGRNPRSLGGSLTETQGATRRLVDELANVAAFARRIGDGRIAVLGHSMASDIVVRFAEETPDVVAVVAVSMFSPAVTATTPRNLLMITGALETGLRAEALRVLGLTTAPQPAVEGVTVGQFADGTARRAVTAPWAEHVGVLYSPVSLAEASLWFRGALDPTGDAIPLPGDGQGWWLLLLIGSLLLMAWPLARALPIVARPPIGAGLPWRTFAWVAAGPPLLAPLLLRLMPTHFLPVVVADYLALHFLTVGLLTLLALSLAGRPLRLAPSKALIVAGGALTIALVAGFGSVLDRYGTSFVPTGTRWPVMAALFVGTFVFTAADEWATRGVPAPRLGPMVTKLAFLVSLGIAVALDFQRLFFLLLIVPIMVPVFIVFGLISAWAYNRTGHPLVGAAATGLIFAWALGVTFPMIAG